LRVWIIALLTLVIQGTFALVGFLVGLVVVGLVLGYRRAWEIATPVVAPRVVDEDD
jgi:hypothetical protein